MAEKKLFKKVNLDEMLHQKNSKISLEYYLLESDYKDEEAENAVKTFGVELIKKEYHLERMINEEQKVAKYLFLDRNKVERLLEDLSNNTVTPMGLYSVLDNLIGVTY